MINRPFIGNCVGVAALAVVWAMPSTSHAGYAGQHHQVYSGHPLPRVQVFSYGISNPYSSRRYRANRYDHPSHGGFKRGVHHGHNRHYHRGKSKQRIYHRGYKQGYRQGIRDSRRARVHQGYPGRGGYYPSHGIRLPSGISGFHSFSGGGYIGYRY